NNVKIILICLLAAAITLPFMGRAENTAAGTPPSSENGAPAKPKKKGTSFMGDLASVDTNAMTLTVSNLTLSVTSDTVIKNRSRSATLADAAGLIGKPIRGTYKKSDDGKLVALTVHLNSSGGSKGGKKKKRAAAAPDTN
ncbi:MAG TPA: hypothetical protein VFC44_12580, partial [Candidatus Saccharimonadales bacterium]|nr:hypothetical protein [Candidatus Saccharimonadales bacterium]